jgi:hypothetical protein
MMVTIEQGMADGHDIVFENEADEVMVALQKRKMCNLFLFASIRTSS